jgi:hypothetical protein
MTPSELTTRVTAESAILVAALAGGAAILGGAPAAGGLLAGTGLALANLRWLTASALAACSPPPASPGDSDRRPGDSDRRPGDSDRRPGDSDRRPGVRWLARAALRLGALTAGAGAVLASGWAHPVAVVAGLTVVPCALIATGLRGARREARG